MTGRAGRRDLAFTLGALAVTVAATTTAIAGTVVAGPSAQAAVASRRLPPAEFKALAHMFDPALRKLGLRTSRAMLQNPKTYKRDAHGSHLALYVQPMSASYTDAEYVTHFVPVAQVFLPSIFERWKGLRSFDVCQEPRPGEDPRPEPPPVTQLYVTRTGDARLKWHNATMADVLEASTHTKPATKTTSARYDVFVYFHQRLGAQPALVQAQAAARATSSSTTTTAPPATP